MEVRSPKLTCRQCGSCLLRLNRLCGEQGLLAGVLGRAECRAHLATALLLGLCVCLTLAIHSAVRSTSAVALLARIVGLAWHLVQSRGALA